MNKLFFMNDYGEGAHPLVMQRLMETNLEHTCGYGLDEYSLRAQKLLIEKIGQPQAQVHMMTGGTSANMIAISAFLRPYEGVIAADSGHINVHETGAVEGSGHKVMVAKSKDGKVLPEGVREVVKNNPDEHTVFPRMVYISQSTEVGTVYTMDELLALRAVCDELGLILYMDGARLGSALAASGITLADLGKVCDCFYIGGTKNGLLFGEAMVIVNPALQPHFRHMIKNRGGMMAKGRLCGVMFLAAFENDDYFAWARHANEMADMIRASVARSSVEFFQENMGNQVFLILTPEQNADFEQRFAYERWGELADGRIAVRFVTSWATDAADVRVLCEAIEAI